MFSIDKAKSLELEFGLPVDIRAQSAFDETIGTIPVKRFFVKGQSTSAFFSFLEKSIPRLDFSLGEAHIAVFRDKIEFHIGVREEEMKLELSSVKEAREPPFSDIALARFSSDLNFLVGVVTASLPKKGEQVKVKGTLRLVGGIPPPLGFDNLFKMPLESKDFKKGRFNGVTFKFVDTMFESEANYEINFYANDKSIRARIEFDTSLAGPLDLGTVCKNLVEWGNRGYTSLVGS